MPPRDPLSHRGNYTLDHTYHIKMFSRNETFIFHVKEIHGVMFNLVYQFLCCYSINWNFSWIYLSMPRYVSLPPLPPPSDPAYQHQHPAPAPSAPWHHHHQHHAMTRCALVYGGTIAIWWARWNRWYSPRQDTVGPSRGLGRHQKSGRHQKTGPGSFLLPGERDQKRTQPIRGMLILWRWSYTLPVSTVTWQTPSWSQVLYVL